MKAGHIPENLLDYEETPGASKVINKWVDRGHEVFVVTETILILMNHLEDGWMNIT